MREDAGSDWDEAQLRAGNGQEDHRTSPEVAAATRLAHSPFYQRKAVRRRSAVEPQPYKC